MAEFKGIKQVLKSEFEQTENKVGYIWFVRETTASTTGEVYLGSRLYGTSEPVPSISAGTNVTIENVGGVLTVSADVPEVEDPVLSSALTVGNAVGYLNTGVTYSAGTSLEQILRDMLIAIDETLNVTLAVSGSGSSLSDVSGATITVTYGGQPHIVQNGTIAIPANTQYTVSVSSVNDYDTPADQVYTSVSNGTRNITFTYAKQQGGSPSDVYAYYGALTDNDGTFFEDADPSYEGELVFDGPTIKAKLTKSQNPIAVNDVYGITTNTAHTQVLFAIPSSMTMKVEDINTAIGNVTSQFVEVGNIDIDGVTYSAYYWYLSGAGFGNTIYNVTILS